MKNLIPILALLAAPWTAAAGEAPVVQVLANLCSGPPADPLPPIRDNSPSAAEMAGSPREHPYLFFDKTSLADLRARAQAEPFLSLAARLRAHAEKCLAIPLPAQARRIEAVKALLPDGSYNPEYLRNAYDDFYKQSYLVKEVIPTLGFAYQLTGDPRYGEAGKVWLLNFASRLELSRKQRSADFDAANMIFSLSLGYDWLAELLDEPQRQLVRSALVHMAGPMVASANGSLSDQEPDLIRGSLGNNHTTRTHGLFGLTPLVLLYEVPEARDWLDAEIQLQRDRLLPRPGPRTANTSMPGTTSNRPWRTRPLP